MKQKLMILVAGALAFSGGVAGADPVTVDTSSLAGQSGFVDFQFNPDTSGTTPLDAAAVVSGFTGGTLGAVDALNTSGVTGALPGGVTISNAGAANGLVQAITFGSSLAFNVALPTPAANALADEGSTFQFFLLDGQENVLATTDPSGADTLATTSQDATGAASPAQVYALVPSAGAAVPEAGAWALLALGLPPLGALALRRRCA